MKIKNAMVVSDLHLGSDRIAEVRGFNSAEDFWQVYKAQHNALIQYSHQPVFILGDIATSVDELTKLVQLKGKLHVVLGNHDILPLEIYQALVRPSEGTVNAMVMLPHQKLVLTHFPVHPSFFEGNKADWLNYHGHLHAQKLEEDRYIGCSYDQCVADGYAGLRPLSF